jgi:CRP-like cAMP-binding protein
MPPSAVRKAHRNRLLKALAAADLELLEPHFEFREFPLRQVFEEPHRPIKYVYFIEQGLASVVANGPGTRSIEVGLIGREGVTGVPVLIGGDRSPHDTYAQIAGSAHRMPASALREAMAASATLRTALLSFVHTFMVQTAQTALANGRANLEERLARWILIARDRADGDDLPLTHEFLSIMLGVRRPGVTVTIRSLERRGLVQAKRGSISLLDRPGLTKVAGTSYGVPEAEYRRLIG